MDSGGPAYANTVFTSDIQQPDEIHAEDNPNEESQYATLDETTKGVTSTYETLYNI